jgi:hypothetical protein
MLNYCKKNRNPQSPYRKRNLDNHTHVGANCMTNALISREQPAIRCRPCLFRFIESLQVNCADTYPLPKSGPKPKSQAILTWRFSRRHIWTRRVCKSMLRWNHVIKTRTYIRPVFGWRGTPHWP